MRILSASLLIAALAAFAATRAEAQVVQGCSFGKDDPLPATSTFADQFRCYQQSGRHVILDDAPAPETQGMLSRPEPTCVRAVAEDRVQLGLCTGVLNSATMIIPFATIRYLIDDPRAEAVRIVTRQ